MTKFYIYERVGDFRKFRDNTGGSKFTQQHVVPPTNGTRDSALRVIGWGSASEAGPMNQAVAGGQ